MVWLPKSRFHYVFSVTQAKNPFGLSLFGFIFLCSDTENVLVSGDIPKDIFDFQTKETDDLKTEH